MTMTTAPYPQSAVGGRRFPGFVLRFSREGLDLLSRWHARHVQRSDLSGLDEHMLRDIGLTRADIGRECGKPFWRP
jgi:uncharacterized protein YjiS (DUF1127 family)